MTSASFIDIAGQHVRLDSITRLSTDPVLGSPNTHARYVYVVDGGILYVTEEEYGRVKQALMAPLKPKKRATETTKKGA
jgi:hypothetical protein